MPNLDDSDNRSTVRVSVALFIIHPTMKFAEISQALGLEPHFIHEVGSLRKNPKGDLLGGRYRDTRWRHVNRYEFRNQHFAHKITDLVDRIEPHKEFLQRLRATGGTATIIVDFLGDGYHGDNVPLSTITKMAELQLDFGIEVFNVPQSE